MKFIIIPRKNKTLVIGIFIATSLSSCISPVSAESAFQGEGQVQDTLKKETPVVQFEIIPVHGLPKYSDVQWVTAKSGLGSYCKKYKIDQLEIDLMFAKTGSHPFDEFKQIKFKNGSGKRFMDIFPGKNLLDFWETARQVLRNYNKESVPIQRP